MTNTTTVDTCAEIRAHLEGLGFTLQGRFTYRLEVGPSPSQYVVVAVDVVGSCTTHLLIDRGNPIRPDAVAEDWFRTNIYPATLRYCDRMPYRTVVSGWGGWCGMTTALTSEALDVLKVCIPQEIAWAEGARVTLRERVNR